MDTLTFNAKRFVRPALPTIALYLTIIMISSMTMIKPAHASGNVHPQPNGTYCATFFYLGGYIAHACSSSYSAACGALSSGASFSAVCGNICVTNSSCAHPAYVTDQSFYTTTSCPANSTGTPATNPTSCTCNNPYVPDSTGTSCVLEQYTISLQIPPPAEVEAGATKSAYAQVMNGSSPQGGVQVNLAVTPPAGGGVATLLPDSGATGSDGKLAFTFSAPVAGSYSLTASCSPACANQATGAIEVKAHCSVDPLPKPPFSGDSDPACTASLEKGAGKDVDHKCPDLTPDMQAGAICLANKIHALAIPYTEPSATVRTVAYQNHLLAVWNKSEEIENKVWLPGEEQACAAVIANVDNEMARHGIDSDPSSSGDKAPHVLRRAIDIPKSVSKALIAQASTTNTVSMLPGCLSCTTVTMTGDVEDYVNSATVNPPACNLRWGGRFTPVDRVHFQLP